MASPDLAITEIHAFLCQPQKRQPSAPRLIGHTLVAGSDTFNLIAEIFRKSDSECKIDVSLRPQPDGTQQNDFRDLLLAFARAGGVQAAEPLAYRLAQSTTHRSGQGLLFIVRAVEGGYYTLLLSRFPTNSAIRADLEANVLSVEYLKSVFVRSATSYKAALFQGRDATGDFWEAKVVDKQINLVANEASAYWVVDFLDADFRTTSAQGSRRLALAIRDASREASSDEKRELHNAAALAVNLNGQPISVDDFSDRFALSDSVRTLMRKHVSDDLRREIFIFNADEYGRYISFRSVELANGVTITAESAHFSEFVSYESVRRSDEGEVVRLSAEGVLKSDKLKRRAG